MANASPLKKREVPLPVLIGAAVIILIIIGVFAWKQFGPVPDPGAGMTSQEKAKSMYDSIMRARAKTGATGPIMR